MLRRKLPYMVTFSRLSLSRQFLVASFPILLLGMLIVGWWVGKSIEHGIVNRLGSVTSHYVESFVSPHLQGLVNSTDLGDSQRAALSALLNETPLGQKIVAFKIWDRNGRVLYSTDPALTGRTFPIGEGLNAALNGIVHSEVSHLAEAENVSENRTWSRLLETYSPIHAEKIGTVIAAAEFYQTPDELFREIRAAQFKSWLLVAATMLGMYLLIFGIVRRGSQTIDAQRGELKAKVSELSDAVAQNAELHERVRRAAVRTTELNERFLRRISTDLHDGPGQDLALALMRLETIAGTDSICPACGGGQGYTRENCHAIYSALQSALTELRAISLGLQLPEIDQINSTEVAQRAVRDFVRKSGAKVDFEAADSPSQAALPVKIALYRLIQESLANGVRHSGASEYRVTLKNADGQLTVSVSDDGAGFVPEKRNNSGHVGLEGMRERVEILGGSFELHSALGQGTLIRATMPQQVEGIEYG